MTAFGQKRTFRVNAIFIPLTIVTSKIKRVKSRRNNLTIPEGVEKMLKIHNPDK